jgi:hypothetical protein
LVPIPFVEPEVKPARVVTAAVEMVMWRIRWLFVSATIAKRLSGEMATLVGVLNFEVIPVPSPEPLVEPAKVVTEEVERAIMRILALFESATRAKTPFAEIVTPPGEENFELVPIPSTYPEEDPARVVTSAVERINLRIRWLLESATRAKASPGEMLIDEGKLKRELVPIPSVEPLTEAAPARVVTSAVEIMILRMMRLL